MAEQRTFVSPDGKWKRTTADAAAAVRWQADGWREEGTGKGKSGKTGKLSGGSKPADEPEKPARTGKKDGA